MLGDEKGTGAHDGRDKHESEDVNDSATLDAVLRCTPERQSEAGEEAEHEQQAVATNRPAAEMEEYRMHLDSWYPPAADAIPPRTGSVKLPRLARRDRVAIALGSRDAEPMRWRAQDLFTAYSKRATTILDEPQPALRSQPRH
jgi:hypothetical protein